MYINITCLVQITNLSYFLLDCSVHLLELYVTRKTKDDGSKSVLIIELITFYTHSVSFSLHSQMN